MKVLILTDSVGNPRSFPESEKTELEETYPYILRDRFKDAVFWQLSYGNLSTEELFSQAIGYLSHWKPDVIIVHSGINDARPEAFGELAKQIVAKFSGPLFRKIKKHVYNPKWIKRRALHRVSPSSFKKSAKKFKMIFDEAEFYWLEICIKDGYESARPGVLKRCNEYNQILREVFKENVLDVKSEILSVNGFNEDNLHWNKHGHRVVAEMLTKKIESKLGAKELAYEK